MDWALLKFGDHKNLGWLALNCKTRLILYTLFEAHDNILEGQYETETQA